MPSRPRLLRAGDLVRFGGRLHTVAASASITTLADWPSSTSRTAVPAKAA